MIEIPKAIIDDLTQYGNTRNLGVMYVVSPNFSVLLIGDKEFSLEATAIAAAHLLLEGVIEGRFRNITEEFGDEGLERLN